MDDGLLDLAERAARDAGRLLLQRFAGPRTGVGTKSTDTDMITDADRAAEDLILRLLQTERPDDAILSEERGESRGTTGLRWVVDPLDGTTNFLFGIPHWAVSVACEDDQGLALGVVYDPIRDELFSARRGTQTTLNGEPCSVSVSSDLHDALIATGFSYRPAERVAAAAVLRNMIASIRDIRRIGAAALDLAWVACGRFDGYCETPISWWDVAAGGCLVEQAGGRVRTIPSVAPGGTGYLAAGQGIFDALSALAEEAFTESHGARDHE